MDLYPHQEKALEKMKNGCILCGDVGSGKSITAIGYYAKRNGAVVKNGCCPVMPTKYPKDLYIITTAKKRNDLEWEKDLCYFYISPFKEIRYKHKVVVDSWNNVKKYINVSGAFFIFDEQRAIGYGTWAKSFIAISKQNEWIMLSATPGDDWQDYIPVFIANGFYRNKTDFYNRHCVVTRYGNIPKIKYYNIHELELQRQDILVSMPFARQTVQHHETIYLPYDLSKYKSITQGVIKEGYIVKWNPYTNDIIDNASEACQCLRRVCAETDERKLKVLELVQKHERAIIFYNYDYELNILKSLNYGDDTEIAEYNGHKHDEVPKASKWVYLVNYTAGCEGWNCVTCDTIIFFSPNYSYRVMTQASGRIDRMNTPYTDLYYYHLTTRSKIDMAIDSTINRKKKFNENAFFPKDAFIRQQKSQ